MDSVYVDVVPKHYLCWACTFSLFHGVLRCMPFCDEIFQSIHVAPQLKHVTCFQQLFNRYSFVSGHISKVLKNHSSIFSLMNVFEPVFIKMNLDFSILAIMANIFTSVTDFLSTEQTIWFYVKMKGTLVREWKYWELERLIETLVESHTLT